MELRPQHSYEISLTQGELRLVLLGLSGMLDERGEGDRAKALRLNEKILAAQRQLLKDRLKVTEISLKAAELEVAALPPEDPQEG